VKRVIIIGNTGAGKTTFARALSEKTGISLVHLDKIFWYGDWNHLSQVEFDEALGVELEKEEWIIDGNYNRTLSRRLEYADTVFYLDFPTITCLWGITERIIKNHGKCREDMGGNCPDSFRKAKELYKSTLSFNRRDRKKYRELLKNCENAIIFRSRRQIKKYLKEL